MRETAAKGTAVVGSIAERVHAGSKHVQDRYDLDTEGFDVAELRDWTAGRLLDRCEPTPTDERPDDPLLRTLRSLEDGLADYAADEDRVLRNALLEATLEEYGLTADRRTARPRGSAIDRYGLDADRLSEQVRETLQNGGHPMGRGHDQGLEPAIDAARGEGNAESLLASAGPLLTVLATIVARRDAGGAGFDSGSDAVRTALTAIEWILGRYGEHSSDADGSGDPEDGDGSERSASGESRWTITRALQALFVANLVAMGLGAIASYRNAPPIPEAVSGPGGEVIVTDEAVRAGKKVFQSAGLMDHGSILGNGGYFGVDLTADALALKTDAMRDFYARERAAKPFDALDDDGQAAVAAQVQRELDATSGPDAEYSAAESHAHRQVCEEYVERYHEGDLDRGIPTEFLDSAEQARRLADFALWTAWISHANRPGSKHSYTNDWPYAPASGNRPPTQSVVWSAISVILLVAGGGAGVWAYRVLDLAEPITGAIDVPAPDEVSVTPAQRAAARYVPVAGGLFALQTIIGGLLAHYHVERTGFYGIFEALGIDIVSLVPFAAGRTWHVNLAVLWISTLWLGGGLFLPGLFADRDPPFQSAGVTGLLGALVIAIVGAFVGVWLGIQGRFDPLSGEKWWWFGNEGLEYLEAGRLWKLMLLAGFAGWTGLVARGAKAGSLFEGESRSELGHLLVYAGGSIALLFAASMLYRPETNVAITEFWRWWVVHMWVEGVFEFFMIAVVSIALVAMGLLEQSEAERAILFEVFAIMGAGIVGVSHHYWWVGLPDLWVPVGTTFSTLEFVPVIFVLYRALGEYRSLAAQDEEFPYTLPFLFIVGATIWNFVGAGVLGFFLNLPLLNYYEHGTYLTLAHSHAATFGAFGLLALGLGVYILRVVTPEAAWDPTWFHRSFWLSNVGLATMVVGSLLPVGFLQLEAIYEEGFAAARDLEFYERPLVQKLSWARLPGDGLVIAGALAYAGTATAHLRRTGNDESRASSA
ncbi:nitric-oxide reductase large subunit [Halococcus sp. AFM35]|uniref:nitric-oxide reductase large subunit n=1 Tax=Halococcus sp. AFM35 TaxID=3421653 RepID=UPI003EBD08A8